MDLAVIVVLSLQYSRHDSELSCTEKKFSVGFWSMMNTTGAIYLFRQGSSTWNCSVSYQCMFLSSHHVFNTILRYKVKQNN